MEDPSKVYLDHLIQRENLRYRRSDEQIHHENQPQSQMLTLNDLMGDPNSGRVKLLRKPDFQRATRSWTPEDCVSLLDSVVNGQVIPSVIMWTSPENGYDYVLDGGHRISVVLAWLRDDWGDSIPDQDQEESAKEAAKKVRLLVRQKIGDIEAYQDAEKQIDRLVNEGKAPKRELDEKIFRRGQFYQRLLKGSVGFHILWATGDYEKAEQSFLKINKSGRQLSDWETKLVENRNSSFARMVMSLTSPSSSKHYWPVQTTEIAQNSDIEQVAENINLDVEQLHTLLFKPKYTTPIKRLQQPLIGILPTQAEKKPYYIAEFMTVIEGGKGHEAETKQLLKQQDNSSDALINNGWNLVKAGLNVAEQLVGTPNNSLALMSALYFYTDEGRYIRSLLYGFVYWMFSGSETDVLNKKRLFSAHRRAIEQVIRTQKEDIVSGITRKTGSGPDITYPTAQYYQGLLELLIKYNDDLNSADFGDDYAKLTNRLTDIKAERTKATPSKSRIFTEKQKSHTVLQAHLDSCIKCGICNGLLDPSGNYQHDHITQWAKGGQTSRDNDRLTHPFCNNQRKEIEDIQNGSQKFKLPIFLDPETIEGYKQLNFFEDPEFSL